MAVATMAPAKLAEKLMAAKIAQDVREVLAAIPDARWEPIGGKRGNLAQVNATESSADAVVERITNGMDALIEREVGLTGKTQFTNPRDAVAELFKIPTGHVAALEDNPEYRRQLADQLIVTLRDSGAEKEPTVNILDHGIGQHPADFSTTLVSLNEENKRSRLYLLGAYGWGGAASFSFCKYAIFVSRRNPSLLGPAQDDVVGWTIIRYNSLADDILSKHGLYEYLCLDGDGPSVIPWFAPSDLPRDHQGWSGTSCTLVQYELSRYSEPTWRPSHSLYLMANALLFDPVLPFLIRDERPKAIAGNQRSSLRGLPINGTAARLAADAAKKEDNQRIDYQGSFGDAELGVTIRYYVLKVKGDSQRDWEPTDVYVTRDQAVTFTHNGQRQASWRRELFTQLGLLALSKFMIVQVDCDGLSWAKKRELFTTTRDRLKDTQIARQLKDLVGTALRSDPHLTDLDRKRKEAAISRRAAEHAERIKKMLQKAIDSLRQGETDLFKKTRSNNPALELYGDQPLVTIDPNGETPTGKPEEVNVEYQGEPTEIRIVNPFVKIQSGGKAVVKIWMDAHDGYIAPGGGVGGFSGLITKGTDDFKVVGYSELRGGFMRCTVSADKASPGARGRVVFSVTRSQGLPLVDQAELKGIEPPIDRVRRTNRKQKSAEAGPDVKPVYRDGWSTLDFDETRVARVETNSPQPGMTRIYVNWDYPPLDAKLVAERKADDEDIRNYKEKFCAALAYAAWLQEEQKDTDPLTEEMRDAELRRSAQIFLFAQFVK